MKNAVWPIVSGEETEPPPDEDIERREWRKRRDKAAGELYLAVSPKQRSHFGGVQDDPVAVELGDFTPFQFIAPFILRCKR